MRKVSLVLILIALLVAACSSRSEPLPEVVTEVPSSVEKGPVETPALVVESTQPSAPSSAAEQAGSVAVFRIVPGETQLVYEVGETFLNQDNRFNLAVGVSTQVEGEVTVDPAAPQNSMIGTVTADISQFQSDNNRRDNAIRDRFLESSKFPIVTFVPTEVVGLPGTYQEGQEIPLTIIGDLTIRDVTRPVTFEASVKLEGNELRGEATTKILMSEFNFGPINIAGILFTEDEAKVSLMLVARP